MMELITRLNISPTELFARLNQSLIDDIYAYTGKKITDQDIQKGLHYQKDIHMNKKHPCYATVEIKDYQKDKTYTISYSSPKRKSLITYIVYQISEYQLELHYQEHILLHKKNQFGDYEFVEVSQQGKLNRVPFFKKIQFRSLVKNIQKQRKNKQ